MTPHKTNYPAQMRLSEQLLAEWWHWKGVSGSDLLCVTLCPQYRLICSPLASEFWEVCSCDAQKECACRWLIKTRKLFLSVCFRGSCKLRFRGDGCKKGMKWKPSPHLLKFNYGNFVITMDGPRWQWRTLFNAWSDFQGGVHAVSSIMWRARHDGKVMKIVRVCTISDRLWKNINYEKLCIILMVVLRFLYVLNKLVKEEPTMNK